MSAGTRCSRCGRARPDDGAAPWAAVEPANGVSCPDCLTDDEREQLARREGLDALDERLERLSRLFDGLERERS